MADSRCTTAQGACTFALESLVEFLQKYPDFTQIMTGGSGYKLDFPTLIADAKKMDMKKAVEDIWKEFDTNGTSSELYEADQRDQKRSQPMSAVWNNQLEADTEDEPTKSDVSANESSECGALQDITNQLKQRCKLRKNRNKNVSCLEHCVFCLNNGADREVYESHNCKDDWGNVTCPVLQKFVCSRCNATGKNAHTAKYCPLKPIITPEDCLVMEQRWQQERRRRPAVTVNTNGVDNRSKPSVQIKRRSRLRF
ncbi:uncharacterized protein LOC128713610 [Anopheles marshallii]|uniref:uncharacterized protein LOC128713610 n=1 Tax=Anopheles marshallii TaxID=1521116 RepID=UPI00237A314D|nr:uncharacterized protein LOC128713610 [Anopheles marshallii]